MSRQVGVRGVQLVYERSGTAAPPFVWGHGLTSSRSNENETRLIDFAALAAEREVVRYDARGHGESGSTAGPAEYAWSELALDQLALADALGIDRYVAGGASMGCGTALHAAVTAPDRIAALVLVIPPTAWETRAAQTSQWEASAHVLETHGVERLIEGRAKLPPPDPFTADRAWREQGNANLRLWNIARLARVFRGAAVADLPGREAITTIGVPTLILAWSGDAAHPVSTADSLHALIAGSQLVIGSTPGELATWTDRICEFLRGIS